MLCTVCILSQAAQRASRGFLRKAKIELQTRAIGSIRGSGWRALPNVYMGDSLCSNKPPDELTIQLVSVLH